MSHGEVMGFLLNQAVSNRWKGDFEVNMLATVCAIVVFIDRLAGEK